MDTMASTCKVLEFLSSLSLSLSLLLVFFLFFLHVITRIYFERELYPNGFFLTLPVEKSLISGE